MKVLEKTIPNIIFFDYRNDFCSDIIFLCKNTSGIKTKGNLTYYYGYEFNPKATRKQQEDFRNNIKHNFHDSNVFYSEDADRFVRDGILFKYVKYIEIV